MHFINPALPKGIGASSRLGAHLLGFYNFNIFSALIETSLGNTVFAVCQGSSQFRPIENTAHLNTLQIIHATLYTSHIIEIKHFHRKKIE